MMAAASIQMAVIPTGIVKSFGAYGPIYEVLGPAPDSSKGKMIAIRVLLSGETLDYPVADMVLDPVIP